MRPPALVVLDVLILALLLRFVGLDLAQGIGFAAQRRLRVDVPALFGGEALLDGDLLRVVIDLLGGTIRVVSRREGGVVVRIDDESDEVLTRLQVVEGDLTGLCWSLCFGEAIGLSCLWSLLESSSASTLSPSADAAVGCAFCVVSALTSCP